MRHPKRRSGSRILIAATLAIAFRAPFVAGQSYGTNDQTLTIGMAEAPSSRATAASTPTVTSTTRVSTSPAPHSSCPCTFRTEPKCGMCARTRMTPSWIRRRCSPWSPSSSFRREAATEYVLTIPGSAIQTTPGAGYASYCTGSMSYTLRNAIDLDGDQVPDNTVYFLKVDPGYHGGIGAVLVTWGRQVSPPPDTPTFGDVPANDVSFPHIEALAASGITAGCGRKLLSERAPDPPADGGVPRQGVRTAGTD